MSPERQRVVIAELCGYKRLVELDSGLHGWIESGPCEPIPDYLNDLNAMHEAERVFLTHKLGPAYQRWLDRLNMQDMDFGVYHATAAQRAEAFLRTLNKWEEST